MGGLSFGQDAEGNWGYIPSGADAVTPFRGPIQKQYVSEELDGSRTNTIDVSGIEGFKNFTVNNFCIEPVKWSMYGGNIPIGNEPTGYVPSMTYDSDTGILTCSGFWRGENYGGWAQYQKINYKVILLTC